MSTDRANARASLVIVQGPDAWYADFARTPEADKMRELFGDTKVPTPFTPTYPAADVLRVVARHNPGYDVVIGCQIQWIDAHGRPTPDSNPSIGRVRTIDRNEVMPDGRTYHHEASQWFHICADHARRMRDPGMHIWEWER